MKIKVLIYPKEPNPYQELLYRRIREKGIPCKYFTSSFVEKHGFIYGIPSMPFRLLFKRLTGSNIFHLHWAYHFLIPIPGKIGRYLSSLYAIYFLFFVKLFGFKLVWTVHNIMPHENQFHNDKLIYNLFYALADAKIVHTEETIKRLADKGFDSKNTYVIEIGNYLGLYQNTISKEEARKKLEIDAKDYVFLFIGMVKKYKGIQDLLKTYSYLLGKKHLKDTKLIIAGKPFDTETTEFISNFAKEEPSILPTLKYIPDNELQVYLNACNSVVLPFKDITTTSSALLAFGFKRAVVAPLIGAITTFPQDTGYYYDKSEGLIKGLQDAYKNGTSNKGENAFEYVKTLKWENSAEKTINLYNLIIK